MKVSWTNFNLLLFESPKQIFQNKAVESPDIVHKLFLDKTGKHLFVATEGNEFYYYSRASKKFRAIYKLKVNRKCLSFIIILFAWQSIKCLQAKGN